MTGISASYSKRLEVMPCRRDDLQRSWVQAPLTHIEEGVMGYAAEMELKGIKKRTAEGREVAKNRGVKFGRKRNYTPQQAAAVMEMRQRGDGYGTIGSAMGMTTSMVRRIIQQQKEVPC